MEIAFFSLYCCCWFVVVGLLLLVCCCCCSIILVVVIFNFVVCPPKTEFYFPILFLILEVSSNYSFGDGWMSYEYGVTDRRHLGISLFSAHLSSSSCFLLLTYFFLLLAWGVSAMYDMYSLLLLVW